MESNDINKTCGSCEHFRPYVDEQTKRVHPSKRGECGWKPGIVWPMAFRHNGYGYQTDPRIIPVGVWPDTNAEGCACFSKTSRLKGGGSKPQQPELFA
jgi:hypothetical protein